MGAYVHWSLNRGPGLLEGVGIGLARAGGSRWTSAAVGLGCVTAVRIPCHMDVGLWVDLRRGRQ